MALAGNLSEQHSKLLKLHDRLFTAPSGLYQPQDSLLCFWQSCLRCRRCLQRHVAPDCLIAVPGVDGNKLPQSATMGESGEGLEAAGPLNTSTEDIICYCIIAAVLVFQAAISTAIFYWVCSDSTGCLASAVQHAAGVVCAVILSLILRSWLTGHIANVQIATLRFWSRALYVAYFSCAIILTAILLTVCKRGSCLGLLRFGQILFDVKILIFVTNTLIPYMTV